jgi:chlorobactene glucosyltransferase
MGGVCKKTMTDFLLGHLNGVIIFLAILLFISLSNLYFIYNPARRRYVGETPFVSVLIPVRNEEDNIASCICSLMAQDYPCYEVIVLDDHSEDRTAEVLNSFHDPRLQYIKGKPLPPGWAGKTWACHQLSRLAKGDYLLFTDADTTHSRTALSSVIAAVERSGAGFVSLMPRQIMGTFLEKLIVPVINWGIFFYLPLFLAYRLTLPFLSAAVGQYILFSRVAYEKCGGHASVKNSIDDDLAMARQVKSKRIKWLLMNGKDLIACRMYKGSKQVWDGFGKNLFSITGYRILPHLFIWLITALVFIEPVVLLIVHFFYPEVLPPGLAFQAAAASLLALNLWLIMLGKFGLPLYLAFLYPVAVFLTVVAALRSMTLHLFGRASWKDRALGRVPIRWF